MHILDRARRNRSAEDDRRAGSCFEPKLVVGVNGQLDWR
jgi:hypothetical protein